MKTAYIAKQRQISFVKSHFSRQLEERLGLIEVRRRFLAVWEMARRITCRAVKSGAGKSESSA